MKTIVDRFALEVCVNTTGFGVVLSTKELVWNEVIDIRLHVHAVVVKF